MSDKPVTTNQVVAAIGIVAAVGTAIRDLGQVPSGELYAAVMGQLSLDRYTQIIDKLVQAKMVRRDASHMLTWIGPKGRNYLEDLSDMAAEAHRKKMASNPDALDPTKWEKEKE